MPEAIDSDRWLLELDGIEKDTSAILDAIARSDRDSLSMKSELKAR